MVKISLVKATRRPSRPFTFFLPLMVRRTLPLIIPILWKNKGILLLLVIMSILLGIVPTVKSDLETGIIDQANSILTGGSHANPANILGIGLQDFSQTANKNADIVEKIASALFHGVTLGLALTIYLVIIAFAFGVNFWSTVAQEKITARIFARLREVAFQRGLVTDPSNLPSLSNVAGQYSIGIHQGADNVSRTYGYVLQVGQHLFSLITIMLLVATKSLVFAFGCSIVVILQAFVSLVQAHRLQRKREDLDKQRNDLVARSDDILSKREIILAYEQQEKYAEKLGNLTEKYAEVVQNLDIQEGKFSNISDAIGSMGLISIIIISLILVILFRRQDVTTVGDIYFLVSIYTRILIPVQNILYGYDDIKRSEATSKTFLELLQERRSVLEPAQQQRDEMNLLAQQEQNLGIRFVDVSFRYEGDESKWVLRNCSFNAPAHSTTLVVGRSGCGKTTIARIILGFWQINQGQVYIDGTALSGWDLAALREKMSYVAQGDHIIDDSVRDNLSWAYTKSPFSDNDMLEVLVEVGIIKNIQERSILEQPARNLSGGQQQRLSIARMILDESPIAILDEPLTGVDVFTLHELLPVLGKALKSPNRTVLMFSHNLTLASYAGHIIVLNPDGSVDEEGEPQQLLAKHGTFTTLYHTALQDLEIKGSLSPELAHLNVQKKARKPS